MANGKFVSYLRVSTGRQGKSGLGLEAQRRAVDAYLNGGDWQLVEEFVEVESGRNSERRRYHLHSSRQSAIGRLDGHNDRHLGRRRIEVRLGNNVIAKSNIRVVAAK